MKVAYLFGRGSTTRRISVCLGHSHLADTQVYLTMTPELLQQASTRFERWYYACRENHHA
jgi:integrase/recombinase XerD